MIIHKMPFTCTRDRLTIHGVEYRPDVTNDPSYRYPAVILSHGFLANQGMGKGYARQLASWGYAAFTFDFCGGGLGSRSDGKLEEMSVLTELADLRAMIEHVKSLPDVDAEHVLLLGMSQGGFVSALAASRLQAQIAGLILFYPAMCIPDDARRGRMMMFKFDPACIPEKITWGPLKLGRCYPEAVKDMNAFDAVSGYRGPVLIIHGEKDKIVPVEDARRAYECYLRGRADDAAHAPVRFDVIEGAGHGFRGQEDRTAMGFVHAWLGETGLQPCNKTRA